MSFADKKGIVVASGFKLQAETLLDVRQQVDTIQERNELVTIHAATPGLRVYVKNDKTSYVYNGTGWDKLTTGNAYVHPTGDGNHHVPATGTTNNGKVLMAGSTAGSESWQTLTTDDISDFPDSLPTPNNLVVKFNGGTSEGANQFTFNGSAAKTVNITPAAIGASASNHTHTHASITDFDDAVGDLLPTKLPNPEALTISLNGTSQGAYTGSAAKSINITPASIGAAASSHTHTGTQVTGLTANRAMISNGSGQLAVSAVTSTELGYLDGVTSAIQTQLNGKAASSHTHSYAGSASVGGPANSVQSSMSISLNGGDTEDTDLFTFDGSEDKTINITPASIGAATSGHTHAGTGVTGLTANRALVSNSSGQLVVSAVTSTELGYLDGVTSAIQTQLNNKAASNHAHNYAGSSSVGGAATSANQVNSDLVIRLNGGTTEDTNQFTFNGSDDKTINITPASIGAAAASHGTHVTYGTSAPLANGTASAGSAASVSRSDHRHPLQTTVSGNAGTATRLATARTIDGVSFNGSANITHFGTCSTAAATAAKVVSCTGFTLATGAIITVKFSATNTAASPTLNVNNTGAKAIMYRGSAISAGYLAANRVYTFVYDGTDYELIGDINTDTNTTYSTGTATTAGLTKLYTGTGTNTNGTMTQNAITTALNGKANSSHTHTSANITDFEEAVGELLPTIPTKLPNPEALTISLNGTSQGAYNGSAAKSINITPASIGAAASSHTHAGTQVTGLTANRAMISNGSGQLAVSAVTSTELGYLDGVTSSIQTQLNGKAASSHTHNYAGSSSAGGAATSANKVNSDLVIRLNGGTTEGSNQFTFNGSGDKTINITPASIGAAASSHGTHVTYGTAAPLANGTASAGSAGSVSRSDHVHPLQTTISGNAGSATKLATARTIDGVSFNGTANITHFGTCSTAAATAAKVVSCTGFTLTAGAMITVKFSATNTAASPTLNVNSTGAKAIMYRGSAISAGYLAANRVYTFVYDGTDYELIGDINTDTNTTYSTGTATKAGITKLYTGTGSNTDGTMTQSAITTALDGKANSSHTHTSANITDFEEAVEELLPTIPTKLPNPYTLTFTGAVSTTYDGSAARTVNIPTSGSTDADLVIKLNGGTTEGTNQFTFDGSTAKTVNITASSIGAAARSHTHSTATTSAAGFLRALNGSTANFLRGDGTWATPPNTTYSAMKGATSSAAGSTGLVPAPAAGKQTSFLRGDGTWVVPTNTNTTYTLTKSGSTITLTGSDGSKTSVTDSNTTYSLSSFGITATAAELNKLDGVTATAAEINYLDGVTSSIQTQLNGKAASSHTHKYAASSSAGGAATSANKVNTNLIIKLNGGTTEGTNQFTFNGSAAKTVNITPAAIGAAAASHGTHVTYSTTAPLAAGTASAGSAATVARSDHRHPLQTTVSGNAGTATKLATARTISLTGDATGSTSFNGSANASIATTVYRHATTSITSNQDLNDFTDPGWYYCSANATVATLDNSPTTNAFTLIVTQHAGYNQLLIEYMTSAPRVFTRNYYNAWGSWYEIYHTGQKPTASEVGAAASSHNHSAANITSGTLAVARGGTGVTANPSMLVNLASTSAASVFAASPRPGVTGALGIANGGTGATTAAAARTALGAAASSHTHTGAQVTGLTASRALVSNSSGAVTVSAVTSTELGYLDGVTSSIQTQLNGKAASSHTHKYAGSSSAGGAATVANKINLPVGTTLFATSSSATFFSATLGGTWTVVGNIDTIVVSSGAALTLYLHRKTAS